LAFCLTHTKSKGVLLANLLKSSNKSLAFSALHSIVVNAIFACSKSQANFTTAFAHCVIHLARNAIAKVFTAVATFKIEDFNQSNFFCSLLVASSPVFL
jgi:hypothetical protein